MSVVPLLGPEGGAVVTHTDVTRLRRAEEEAVERESGSRRHSASPRSGVDWNLMTDAIQGSDEAFGSFGWPPRREASPAPSGLERMGHPEDREASEGDRRAPPVRPWLGVPGRVQDL